MMTTMMRNFGIHSIIIPLLTFVAAFSAPDAGAVTAPDTTSRKAPAKIGPDDYGFNTDLADFEFVHTHGVASAVNRGYIYSPSIRDWCNWEECIDADGKWLKDVETLRAAGVEPPDFTLMTSDDDPRIEIGKRQRAHTEEMVVYALPGDVIVLYPFRVFDRDGRDGADAYQENYIRWYDYSTDGNNPYLGFLTDPEGIYKTDNIGYFGGKGMYNIDVTGGSSTEDKAVHISTVDQYKKFAERVNAGETSLNAVLDADLDFAGRTDIPHIGNNPWGNYYIGTFDGQGHTISNLTIDRTSEGWISGGTGMFGNVQAPAIIRNFNLENARFVGSDHVGVVGYNHVNQWSQNTKSILIENVGFSGTIIANNGYAGGILGGNDGAENVSDRQTIRNCYVMGTIQGSNNSAAICGYAPNTNITNCWSTATVTGASTSNGITCSFAGVYESDSSKDVKLKNCYAKDGGNNLPTTPEDLNSQNFADLLGNKYWQVSPSGGHVIPAYNADGDSEDRLSPSYSPVIKYRSTGGNRTATIATFHVPEGEEFGSAIIAADLSNTFIVENNIDVKNKKIYEPITTFRKLFNIRNGATFAEEFSGSKTNNDEYIRKNRRHIKARAGTAFQIRLKFKMPASKEGKSNIYYKKGDGTYDRVHRFKIEVTDRATNEITDKIQFAGHASYEGQGVRDGVNIGEGGTDYFRAIRCEQSVEGNFLIRLIALDENDAVINIFGEKNPVPLVVAEYEVDFEKAENLSFVPEDELKTNTIYNKHTDEYLEQTYGLPYTSLDYDQYQVFETLGNPDDYLYTESAGEYAKRIKWPKPWGRSTYGFAYNVLEMHYSEADPEIYNFGVYVYAKHSAATPWHDAAKDRPAEDNFGVADGLFDRLFYRTEGKQQGYFGYVNASADPGVIGNLYINDMCDGSTVFGTAWVAEFSASDEKANVVINFNAVLKDGTTHALKSINSGYITETGKWYHLFFSFTPNLRKHGISEDDVASYHVTIENNCTSSRGADYAIDDIRLYIVKPHVDATQTAPTCSKDESLDIRVSTPFETMLSSTGSVEALSEKTDETKYIYYSFVRKNEYDNAIKNGLTHQEAFEKAVLRYKYNLGGKTERFGRFTFHSLYNLNPEYEGFTDNIGEAAYRKENPTTGERMLVFNTRPQDKELVPGKEYYLVFYPSAANEEIEEIKDNPSAFFEIIGSCTKWGTFKVESSEVVKIDGVPVTDLGQLTVCENQMPIVHVDVFGAPADGTRAVELIEENSYMDWYNGSLEQYNAEKITDGGKDLLLSEVMIAFRGEYPKATTWDCPAIGKYTEAMRQYLKTMTTKDPLTHKAKLILYRNAYLFSQTKYGEYSYAVAIPIAVYDENYVVCTDPLELKLNVSEHTPRLSHGLPVEYPEDMDDVPLRIGLNQIRQVSGDSKALIEGTADTPTLNIPLRSITPVTEGVTSLIRSEDIAVYLAETNDPEYATAITAASDLTEVHLIEVGAIKDIVAEKDGAENVISLSFFDNFKFKEGYYYSLRFNFVEDETQITNPDDVNVIACGGQQVFTIKVVPEYMQWTGEAGNRNWNNDLNWRRVTSNELLRTQSGTDDFTTDGSNANSFSYSPLDFTKTIIPAGIDCPYLFNATSTTFTMTEDGKTLTMKQYEKPYDSNAGDPTDNIEYDMAARGNGENINCGPWMAHTCDQIHFSPDAEIMNQNFLTYKRAWAEFELSPDRWYTLASPLKATVAGDMYLPTANARQATELFKPITFKTGLNDRFAPAVYQRAWNKGTATVYEIKDGPSRNVAVKTVWSNVYNDVKESYGAGTGFSINTDVSRLSGTVDKVLFRLPKDDASYDYYNEDGSVIGNKTDIEREPDAQYRLNDVSGTITVDAAAPCRYFLVGNPFMAHIDMAAFLDANSDKINPKYWVLTDGGYAAVSKDDAGSFTATISNPGVLAPMQGFFVEAKNESSNVNLTYTADMLTTHTRTDGDTPLHAPARSEDGAECLRLTAMTGDGPVSQALVQIRPDAVSGYDEREDVAMLDGDDVHSTAKIYTIAGNMAASINTLPEIGTTEIGLLADNDHTLTTLRFNGADCVNGAMLYDTESGESTPIYEDMEYTVEGSALGRLFITTSLPGPADHDIRITQSGNTVTVTSSLPVAANVYDMPGRRILARSAESGITSFTLNQGVYVIEANNGDAVIRQKIAVQ